MGFVCFFNVFVLCFCISFCWWIGFLLLGLVAWGSLVDWGAAWVRSGNRLVGAVLGGLCLLAVAI